MNVEQFGLYNMFGNALHVTVTHSCTRTVGPQNIIIITESLVVKIKKIFLSYVFKTMILKLNRTQEA